jgi:hypothetical protein
MVAAAEKKNPRPRPRPRPRGRPPSFGFPRWAAKLLFIEGDHVQASALAKFIGITRASLCEALGKHGLSVSLKLEAGHYCGYFETAKLHDLARRAIAREQDATKNSISVKNKEVGLCS